MHKLVSNITITNNSNQNVIIKGICEIQIISTWRSLTNTCKLTIPRSVKWEDKNIRLGDGSLIQEGNKITVELGYDDKLNVEFEGYVKTVGAGFPIVLDCEDNAYLLKKHKVENKDFQTSTLQEVIEHCLPAGISFEAADVKLGRFIINNTPTAAKVFDEISRQYNLPFFFRDGVLLAGLPYWPDKSIESTFKFGFNIISDNLQYVKEEDLQLRVKSIGIMADNTKYEASVGDESGELRTFYFYNVDDKVKLKEFAEEQLKQLKYTGLQGNITGFGIPVIDQGDICHIIDELEETKEREGKYQVEKVVTRFGYSSGFRREISLGRKVA